MDRRTCMAALLAAGAALAIPGSASAGKRNKLSAGPLQRVVDGLHRPEGIAVARDGTLVISNEQSAAALYNQRHGLRLVGEALAPCGVAIDPEGRIIIANMGLLTGKPGPLQRLNLKTGSIETLVSELEGRTLVASNNPVVAKDGTIYCSHSAWGEIRVIGKTRADGFVYRVAPDGQADIVARNIRSANGCCLSPDERHLYVASTAEGRIMRYPRRKDGSLGPVEDYGPPLGVVVPDHLSEDIRKLDARERGTLGYCDGMAFDEAGNLWITLPFANRIVGLTPKLEKLDILHDPDGKLLNMPTNLAWGGPDRRDLFIVSRGNGSVVRTRTSVRGARLPNQR